MRLPVFVAVLLCVPLGSALSAAARVRPRVVVMTDFYKDPDDKQSLIRLLAYANEFEIEGILATSLAYGDGSVRPEWIRETIGDYGKVEGSLRGRGRTGFEYPSAESLARVVKAGAPVIRNYVGPEKGFPIPYPPGRRDSRTCDPASKWIGPGRDTPASRHIVQVVDREDPRPVWVLVWGGAMDLAQALWQVREQRAPEEARRFVSKLRVYQVSWQDTGTIWIWEHFPELFLILNVEAHRGIYMEGSAGLRDAAWLKANVRNRGPLGASYPNAGADRVKEGDTASFLHLLAPGLSDPERPEWGGWGGRFRPIGRGRRFYVAAGDDHPGAKDEDGRERWTMARWNEAVSNDFAARMAWCVGAADRNPIAVVDRDAGEGVLRREVAAGARIRLDASRSRDPDGGAVDCHWWQYREAGSYRQATPVLDAHGARAVFTAPAVARRETIHIVLAVTGRGATPLTSYRRLIFTVVPTRPAR